ncbi:DUF3780 domain-containing protein [Spirochaetota bacterium]
MTKTYFGFGYNPTESENHFYVIIPKEGNGEVEIYERFQWDAGEQKISNKDILKLRLSRYKWSKLSNDVTAEFNARLKSEKKPTSRFLVGDTPIEKQFGKELMVLLWGIENNDPAGIPTAIRNWKGLQAEERWWLYTMTNASTGKINDKRGWRSALRYALCENPVDDSKQMSLFE